MTTPAENTEVVKPEPIAPAPVAAEPDEATLRKYVREKWGIEDDPDTYKGKAAKWREYEEKIPQYEQALGVASQIIRTYQGQPAPQAGAPPQATPDEEAQLRELARIDPWAYDQRVQGKRRQEIVGEAEQRAYARLQYDRISEQAGQALATHWPEAYDTTSDLHKLGRQIYYQEMSDLERAHPHGFYVATERAAGRLGLAPKGRRSPVVDKADEVGSQNVERRGSRAPASEPDDLPRLTAREQEMVERTNVDPKVFARMKKARMEKKNVRVDE